MNQHVESIDPDSIARAFHDDAIADGYASTSARVYFFTVRRFLQWVRDVRQRRLSEVDGDDLKAWCRYRLTTNATGRDTRRQQNTVYRQATQVKTFLRWCVDNDFCRPALLKEIQLPAKGQDRLVEPLSRTEVDRLLEFARKTGSTFDRARNYALMVFLYDTLLRISEALSLELTDLDRDRITVHGKGDKWRTVALNPGPGSVINAYVAMRRDNNPMLWVHEDGRTLAYHSVQVFMRDAGLQLRLKDTTAHNLRRTAATEMIESDVPTPFVQYIGGWEDLRSLNRYIAFAGKRSAIEKHRRCGPAARLFE